MNEIYWLLNSISCYIESGVKDHNNNSDYPFGIFKLFLDVLYIIHRILDNI